MSEFLFGCGNGKVSKAEQARVAKAIQAADIGCRVTFVAVDAIGVGTRYWFAAPNRGNPFDQRVADATLKAVGHIKTLQANGRYA